MNEALINVVLWILIAYSVMLTISTIVWIVREHRDEMKRIRTRWAFEDEDDTERDDPWKDGDA